MDYSSLPTVLLIALVINGAISGCLCAYVADYKNWNAGIWLVIGLFTGIYGLIAIAGFPVKTQEMINAEKAEKEAEKAEEESFRKKKYE